MPGVIMEGIRKFYPSTEVLANDDVSLRVEEGEIHALVGENGAGKSTLMRILYGLEPADAGTIRVGGAEVRIPNPAAAKALGIGMVHQHFMTIPPFSVAENVVLGAEPRIASLFFDRCRAEREVAELIEDNGFHLTASARASSLTVAERQQLEILKLLYQKAEILILDEPTAVLAEPETHSLFETLLRLRGAGKTLILITHKVREVKEIADSVTVMRRGRSIVRLKTQETEEKTIAGLMMGGETGLEMDAPDRSKKFGAEVFVMRSVSLRARGRLHPSIDSLSLSVRSGEIVGVCGMVGNGLDELEDLASGFVRPSSGEILLEASPLGAHRKTELGYVPADRIHRGSCLVGSVAENLIALDRSRYFPRGLADRVGTQTFAEDAISRFSIAARPGTPMGLLSGGNIQKVILAREFAGEASFLVFSNPTWGLDLGSTTFVYNRIASERARGAAVLLISANLDEILDLADRVAVMCQGRLVYSRENGPGLSRELLGEYLLGLRSSGEKSEQPRRGGHGRA